LIKAAFLAAIDVLEDSENRHERKPFHDAVSIVSVDYCATLFAHQLASE
jgi:hypothetical protein